MVNKELLAKFGHAEQEIKYWRGVSDLVRSEIVEEAGEGEDVTAAGVRVYWKEGRKDPHHKQAAEAAGLTQWSDVVKEHTSTPAPSISWDKVTKAADIKTAPFTTQADPVLTIEVK